MSSCIKGINLVMHLEAISKKSFAQSTKGGQVSVLGPRFNSSEYLGMRVENPATSRGGLNLGPAFLSRWVIAGDLESKSYF